MYYLDVLLDGIAVVSLSGDEIYEGLERGVFSAAISGSLTGYELELYEPCSYLVDLQLGSKFGVFVVGQSFWDKLPYELKDILRELGAEFAERGFAVAREATLDGIENNRNAGMLWIPTKSEWMPIIREVVMTKVVPNWIERSGPEAENLFNEYLAPYAGFTAYAADLHPPVISGVAISDKTDSSATITWTTDEESTSQVDYWEGVWDSSRIKTNLDEELVTNHSVTLDELDPDITYSFYVKSKDASGNEARKGNPFFLQLSYLLP